MSDINENIDLKCECGADFQRPSMYKVYYEQTHNVSFKWKLKYCDSCFDDRVKNAFKCLPHVIEGLINDD